jgi:hypothetical protein
MANHSVPFSNPFGVRRNECSARREMFMRALCLFFVMAWSVSAKAQIESVGELALANSIVSRYCKAWSTIDPEERKRAIEEIWAEGGEYLDSQPVRVTGRDALGEEIVKFQKQFPGARFQCSAVRAHHGFIGYEWSMVMPDGSESLKGIDFGEVDSVGRLVRIVSFFDMQQQSE